LRRSKLETCVSILETLSSNGPLKITHAMHKANLNCTVLKNYFDFLIKQGAVEETSIERERSIYAITDKGLSLIKYFKELNQMIPTMKINQLQLTKANRQPISNVQKEYCKPCR
jgi:predicted transcriptional regulator